MIKKLCAPHSEDSLFACRIYYNCNHHTTGTQVIKMIYSYDLAEERANFRGSGRLLNDYNGYRYMTKFLDTLSKQGKLWYALILNNQDRLEDGSRPIIEEVQPKEKVNKRFNDSRPSDFYHDEESAPEHATAAA